MYALTTHQLQVERHRPIKWMRSPHTATGGGEERHRANQVYVLTTHQLQVERRERHRANQVYASPHTSYRGEERVIEPIKCLRSPHQLQVERRET